MSRYEMKETAKTLLRKNRWLCVLVAFIVGQLGGLTIDFTDKTKDLSLTPTDITDILTGNFSRIMSEIEGIFQQEPVSTPILILSLITTIAVTYFLSEQIITGGCRFFLKYRKNQPVDLGELIQCYKDKTFLNVAKVTLIRDVNIALWGLLFVIPGIIKAYEYSMVKYILSVNPTIDYRNALDLSKKIMRGHKFDLFILHMSFIGWHFLSVFTFGILSIVYVAPYQLLTETEFFANVRELAILNCVITHNDIPDYDEYIPYQTTYQNYSPDTNNQFQQPDMNGFNTTTQPTEPSTQYDSPVYSAPQEDINETQIESDSFNDNNTQ